MIPERRVPPHPGEILREEFLEPLALTKGELAAHLGIPLQRIHEIVRRKRSVTPETAWLLAGAFSTTPEFWLNLQMLHDLSRTRPPHAVRRIGRSA